MGLWPDEVPFPFSDGTGSPVLDALIAGPAAALTAVALVVAPGARASGWGALAAIELAARWRGTRRVVLADLDLEQPALHTAAQLPNDEGVIDLIEYGISLGRLIRSAPGGAYDFLPAGLFTPEPGDILRHEGWTRVLMEVAARRGTLLAWLPSSAAGIEAVVERAGAVLVLAEPGEGPAVVERLPHPFAVLAILTPAATRSSGVVAAGDAADTAADAGIAETGAPVAAGVAEEMGEAAQVDALTAAGAAEADARAEADALTEAAAAEANARAEADALAEAAAAGRAAALAAGGAGAGQPSGSETIVFIDVDDAPEEPKADSSDRTVPVMDSGGHDAGLDATEAAALSGAYLDPERDFVGPQPVGAAEVTDRAESAVPPAGDVAPASDEERETDRLLNDPEARAELIAELRDRQRSARLAGAAGIAGAGTEAVGLDRPGSRFEMAAADAGAEAAATEAEAAIEPAPAPVAAKEPAATTDARPRFELEPEPEATPEPEAAAEPEATTEAKTGFEPEPEAAATPEATTEAKTGFEPEPTPEPEAAAEPEAATEAKTGFEPGAPTEPATLTDADTDVPPPSASEPFVAPIVPGDVVTAGAAAPSGVLPAPVPERPPVGRATDRRISSPPIRRQTIQRPRFSRPLVWTIGVVALASLLAGAWHFLGTRLAPPAPAVAPQPVPVAPPAAPGVENALPFVVAIEAHRELPFALNRVADLAELEPELSFHIETVERNATVFHFVMAGPVADSATAIALRDTLIARGHKTAATPTDIRATPLAFLIGDYGTMTAADEQVEVLRSFDIPGYVLAGRAADSASLYRLYVGGFSTEAEAGVVGQLLRAAGIRDSLVMRTGSTYPAADTTTAPDTLDTRTDSITQ